MKPQTFPRLMNEKPKVVTIGGEDVALFNVDGQICAISNTCAHRGGPLSEGTLEGKTIICPWHGWKFNVKDGKSLMSPSVSVKKYNVKMEDGKVLVSD